MKRILLASASIVAFAGAAAAEVSFGGSATLGYNDEEENGFFVESGLNVTFAQELNNGLRAGVRFSLDIEDSEEDEDEDGDDDDDNFLPGFDNDDFGINDDFQVFLESDQGALRFGGVPYAAQSVWNTSTSPTAGAGTDFFGRLAADDFSERTDETVLRAETTFNDITGAVSYNVADADGDSADDLDQLSLGASGSFGAFTFGAAYQQESDAINRAPGGDLNGDGDTDDAGEGDDSSVDGVYDTDADDDFVTDEVYAVSVGTTFSGADIRLAYANNTTQEESSLGLSARYPFGPVTVGAYYTLESDDTEGTDDPDDSYGIRAVYSSGPITATGFYDVEQGDDLFGADLRYDTGANVVLNAGIIEDGDDEGEDERYVAAIFDLGGPEGMKSTATISYAETDAGEDGGLDDEYKEGTTAAVTFRF